MHYFVNVLTLLPGGPGTPASPDGPGGPYFRNKRTLHFSKTETVSYMMR